MTDTDTSPEAVERLIAEIPGVKDTAQEVWDLQEQIVNTLRALSAKRDALKDERDRQYDENTHRIAEQAKAEAEVARLREAVTRLCDWIEDDCGADLPFDARADLQETQP